MAKHFKIGGSTAKRTLNCPAWVAEAAKTPPVDRSSPAAERGTAMHEVLELMLGEKSLDQAIAQVDYEFDEHDIDQIIKAYQAVETLWEQYSISEYETEPLMSVADDVGGSADIVAAGFTWTLVADFKFGRVPVDPINNPQILFYHWLATQDDTVRDLTLGRKLVGAIIQPAVSSQPLIYEYSPEEIAAFDTDIRLAIEAVRNDKATPVAGDHCAYCPAEPYCAARREMVHQARLVPLEQAESLAKALSLVSELEAFIKATREEADRVMKDLGVSLPGYKLVAKKQNRKFANPLQIAEALLMAQVTDIYTEPSLKSPAQIEKVLKSNKIDFDLGPYLAAPSGELEVAPETDKRDAVVLTTKSIGDILNANLANKS